MRTEAKSSRKRSWRCNKLPDRLQKMRETAEACSRKGASHAEPSSTNLRQDGGRADGAAAPDGAGHPVQRHLLSESGDRRRACRRQKAADRRGARRCGLRDAFTRAVSRFSASQSDAAFVGNERFAADSGDYSGRGREHQRFAKMAGFFRAEHAALRICQVRDGHFHGRGVGSPRRGDPSSVHGHCAAAGCAGRDVSADSGTAESLHRRQHFDLRAGDAFRGGHSEAAHGAAGCGRPWSSARFTHGARRIEGSACFLSAILSPR